MEMDRGDDYTKTWMSLRPLSCTLRNWYHTKFCYNFLTIKNVEEKNAVMPPPPTPFHSSAATPSLEERGKRCGHWLSVSTLLLLFSCCVQLFWESMDCSPLGSSVHGISQARILEQAAISFPGDLHNPGIKPVSPALVGGYFTTEPSLIRNYFLKRWNFLKIKNCQLRKTT